MKKLTLRVKLFIVFLAVGIIVAVLTAVSANTINKLAGKYADIINGNYSIASEAAEMNRNTEAAEKYILAAIASEDAELADNYLELAQAELDALREHYDSISRTGAVSEELLSPIEEFVSNDMQVKKTMFSSIRGGNYNIARNMFFSEYRTALENVNISVNNLSSVMNSQNEVWAKTAEISHFNSLRACIILCLLCISVITFSGLYLEKALPDENAVKAPANEDIPRQAPVCDTEGTAEEENEDLPSLSDVIAEKELALQQSMQALNDSMLSLKKSEEQLEKARLAADDAAGCIDRMADGCFDITPEADYGEYPHMLSAVNKMKAYLLGLSGRINRAADHILAESDRAQREYAYTLEQINSEKQRSEAAAAEFRNAVNDLYANISGTDEISKYLTGCQNAANAKQKRIFSAVSIAKRASEDNIRSCEELTAFSEEISEIAKAANMLSISSALAAAKAASDSRGFAAAADSSRLLASRASQAAGSITELTNRFAERLRVCSELISQAAVLASESPCDTDITERMNTLRGKLRVCAEEINTAAQDLSIRNIPDNSGDRASSARVLREQAEAMKQIAGRE